MNMSTMIIKQPNNNLPNMNHQFKLHELVGINCLQQFLNSKKEEIKIHRCSNLEKYPHWDCSSFSGYTNKVAMINEIKVIYKDDKYKQGRLKKKKYDELIKLTNCR